MTHCRLALVLTIASVICTGISPVLAGSPGPAITRKVLIIGIDGLRPDAMQNAATPNLDALIAAGAVSYECMAEDRTISGPGWSSICCGVHRDKHGVVDNTFTGANYGQYPHWFARLQSACDAMTVSIVDWAPINTQILQGHADVIVTGVPDVTVASAAADVLLNQDPDAVFLHFDDVDHAGHANGFGPNIPAYLAEIADTDTLIGQVLSAMQTRDTFASEDWLVIVTSDHGGTPNGSHGQDIPEHRLTPLIISGLSTAQGTVIDGETAIVDVATTAMTFLGVPIDPAWGWDGFAVGLDLANSPSQPFHCQPPPPPPVGACCSQSGVCSITLEADCNALRGVFRGVDSPCATAACRILTTILAEDFESLPLGPNVDEALAGASVWTPTPPMGWSIDRSGVPAGGVAEWRGWSIADRAWWSQAAGDQNRSLFTRAIGAVAVADPDEWDDLAHSAGTFNSTLTTPPIALAGLTPGTTVLFVDSSWRPEANQTASLSVSFDGAPPVTLFSWSSQPGPNFKPDAENEALAIAITNPSNATSMVLSFALTNAGNNWWWALDNLQVVAEQDNAPSLLFFEDFEGLQLGPNINETLAGQQVWTDSPPAGWTLDDSGVPAVNDPAVGVTEWEGWAFTDRLWWSSAALDQNRSQFTRAIGTVAVADPDEWDDRGSPSLLGPFNGVMTSRPVSLNAIAANSIEVSFDSSWRYESLQRAVLTARYGNGVSQQVFEWTSAPGPRFKPDATNEHVSLTIANPAGASSLRLEFALLDARNNWWWAIDNLRITGRRACNCDWNGDGLVAVPDIFSFLSSWFVGEGDFDTSGQTAVPDIFAFLACYFTSAGPCAP